MADVTILGYLDLSCLSLSLSLFFFFREEYCQRLTPNMFPVNGSVDACMCMFKNLKKDEIEGDTYIVVRIVRHGCVLIEENKRNNTNVTCFFSSFWSSFFLFSAETSVQKAVCDWCYVVITTAFRSSSEFIYGGANEARGGSNENLLPNWWEIISQVTQRNHWREWKVSRFLCL